MYTPQLLPKEGEDMEAFLSDEFNRVAASYNNLQDGLWEVAYNIPERIKPGMVKMFDGVDANPSGLGLNTVYYYGVDEAWRALAPVDILGTSAASDLVETPVDVTDGRVLTVGYMGLGKELPLPLTDLDGYTSGGKYVTPLGTLNRPTDWPDEQYTVEVTGGVTRLTQTIVGSAGKVATRTTTGGSFEPWVVAYNAAAEVTWTPLTLLSGWTNIGGAYISYYRKCAGGVDLIISANSGTLTSGTVIGVLPVGMRPLVVCGFPVFTSNISGISQLPRMEVHPTGEIKIYGFPAGATLSGFTGRVPI